MFPPAGHLPAWHVLFPPPRPPNDPSGPGTSKAGASLPRPRKCQDHGKNSRLTSGCGFQPSPRTPRRKTVVRYLHKLCSAGCSIAGRRRPHARRTAARGSASAIPVTTLRLPSAGAVFRSARAWTQRSGVASPGIAPPASGYPRTRTGHPESVCVRRPSPDPRGGGNVPR